MNNIRIILDWQTMEIDAVERTIQISVGELARFQNGVHDYVSGGLEWRAELGRKWHDTINEETKKEDPLAQFEVTIKQNVFIHNWNFQITGRIDQIVSGNQRRKKLIEIKSVSHPLPEKEEYLKEKYPHYFAQVAIYKYLAERDSKLSALGFSAEIHFVDINSGIHQNVSLDEDAEDIFKQQTNALLPFLNDRLNAKIRLNDIALVSPFPELRDGQADLLIKLEKASLDGSHILLQAPTGFGKTGIVLHHAFTHMKKGFYERLIYLTSKSTGQIQTLKQLNKTGVLRNIQMRNRNELSINSDSHQCSLDTKCDESFNKRMDVTGLDPEFLFESGNFSKEEAKEKGIEFGLCPYALTKWALQFAEIWIGDTNYLFAPNSRNVFWETFGFNPQKTLVIIDEAHNLPERTADALSFQLSSKSWEYIIENTLLSEGKMTLYNIGSEILAFLKKLKEKELLSATDTYLFLDLMDDFSSELKETHIDSDSINRNEINKLYEIPQIAEKLKNDKENYLLWSPQKEHLTISCLDPSDWISNCLKPFASSIHMSATLEPFDYYQEKIGLPKSELSYAKGFAPWRSDAYTVAFDQRVDTRYKERANYYLITAETILKTFQYSKKPIVVFFPSYQYAQDVKTYLNEIDSFLPVITQEKKISLDEQKAFIEESVSTHCILFLILGSSFTEGIDTLGGKIESAIVVSPALPQINLLSETKMNQALQYNKNNAFQKTYIIPAFQKIHQALGRLARAPGQKAKILLHCRRFLSPQYKNLLAEEYNSGTIIKNSNDLETWLST
ncbi:MAG: ATP-dependent DNA helicase [Coraliomargaritaceae bacterium]